MVQVVPGRLENAALHGQVVVPGGDDQVGLLDQAVLVHPVVVQEETARRLDGAHPLGLVDPGHGAHPAVENGRVGEQQLHAFHRGEQLDEAGVMGVKVARHRPGGEAAEMSQLPVGQFGAAAVDQVEPGQRPHPVHAVRVAVRLVVGEFEVGPGLHRLADGVRVVGGVEPVGEQGAVRVDDPHQPVVVLEPAARSGQSQEQAGEAGEHPGLLQMAGEQLPAAFQVATGQGLDLRDLRQDGLPGRGLERCIHPAGHDPGRVDASAGQAFDHLLAESAQADAVAGELQVRGRNAEEIACCRRVVHAQQQVRGAEVEPAERVALDELAEVEDAPQVGRGLGDAHRQQLVTGLGRGQDVAHRADAADACGQRRHLEVRPADHELLEAADLGHLKAGLRDPASLVEQQGDAGMALDTGDGFDDDLLCHGLPPYAPKRVASGSSGIRPSLRATSRSWMQSAGGGQPGTNRSTVTTVCRGRACSFKRGRSVSGTPGLCSGGST